MNKLTPITVSANDTTTAIIDKCYDEFKNTLLNKGRPKLGEREIYIPIQWLDCKADIFWHISSIEPKPKLSIQPCVNDISSSICKCNCVTQTDSIIINGEEREKCIYRAVRSFWISKIVELYNDGDQRISYWEKINSKKKNRIYLRYQEEEIDYIIVFEEKSSVRVVLITAYPVFYISSKNDFNNDYNKYISSKSSE